MIMLAASVTGCDSLSAQDRAVLEDLRSQLDFGRFRSAAEAEAALAVHFPRFDDAHYATYASPEAAEKAMASRAGEVRPLLAYLDETATKIPGHPVPKKVHKKVAWPHPRFSPEGPPKDLKEAEARVALWKKNLIPVDHYRYTVYVPKPDDNGNLWWILLVASEKGVLLDSEIRLTYMDENFSARGVPFRVVNAIDGGPEWTRKVLFNLLGDDITLARVDKLMTEGDTVERETKKNKDDSVKHIYAFREASSRIISHVYGDNRLIVMSWTFDANGKFRNLYMTGDKTYTTRGSR